MSRAFDRFLDAVMKARVYGGAERAAGPVHPHCTRCSSGRELGAWSLADGVPVCLACLIEDTRCAYCGKRALEATFGIGPNVCKSCRRARAQAYAIADAIASFELDGGCS